MIEALLIKLLPFKWIGVAFVGLGLLGVIGYDRAVIAGLRVDVTDAVRALSDYQREQYRAAFVATETNRKRTDELAARARTAEDAYAALQTEHVRSIVAQRRVLADNGRLRDEIDAFARGRGVSDDSAAAASERAATLGLLLAEALRADAESANDAERNADAVRAVLDAWPQ